MADVEASFEERYTKLKLVAIKLKKKTVDQVLFYLFYFLFVQVLATSH
jgi:hypothetical protein